MKIKMFSRWRHRRAICRGWGRLLAGYDPLVVLRIEGCTFTTKSGLKIVGSTTIEAVAHRQAYLREALLDYRSAQAE